MFELFSAIELTNAAMLAAGLAAPLLVIAYLRKRSERRLTVSSVLILQKLAKRRKLERRFKPPLRFFLELLALLLLVSAAAGPVLEENRRKVAIVVDTSLSMRAAEPGGTRLEQARAAVKEHLAKDEGERDYTVFTSGPVFAAVGRKHVDAEEAADYLSLVSAGSGGDALESSLIELGESAAYDEIVVATDKLPPPETDAKTTADDSAGKTTAVSVLTVGSPVANHYVAGVEMANSGITGPGRIVAASIASSGAQAARLKVSLAAAAAGGSGSRLLQTQTIESQPSQIQRVEFASLPDLAPGEVFRVRIEGATADAIAEDDSAWINPSGSGGTKILLVSPAGEPGLLGLGELAGIQATRITPAEYARLADARLERYSLIVFHRSAPARAPAVPSLLVLPPGENPLFPVARELRGPKISSWKPEHPITAYLKVQLLAPQSVAVFALPLWAQAVINVENGPLVAAGESRGVRFAAVGMELLPFEGTRTPLASVLLLNIFNWLSGGNQLSTGALTGGAIRFDEPGVWQVSAPDGSEATVNAAGDDAAQYIAKAAGPYRLRRLDGASSGQADAEVVVVNSFFPLESATYSRAMLAVPRSVPQREVSAEGKQPLWQYLAVIALLALAAEYLLHFRGKRRTLVSEAA